MTPTELIARFPELSAESTPRLQLAIDDATLLVGTSFGKFYEMALAYMSAHLFTMGKQSSTGNAASFKEVASESVGSVSVSYVTSSDGSSGGPSDFSSTIYGQQFENLKKRACFGSVLIG